MPSRSAAIYRPSIRCTLLGLISGLFMVGCTPTGQTTTPPITVFAAASLTDALNEIATDYEHTSGQKVRLSFAASGAVARQITAGAPADVVILADEIWMDRLEANERLAPGSRRDLLGNRLVVIAPADASVAADPLSALAQTTERLAIGDPESVPAGKYARTWLRTTGHWDALQPRIVTAADVRAVRTFVQRGEAALGIAYRSDMVGAPGVKIVLEPAASEQPRIVYPAATTREGGARATAFLDYLEGAEANRIFVARGFEPLS